MNIPMLVAEWQRIREAILITCPDIDAETLTDTLDGEAAALDAVAYLIRQAREDDAQADAVASMIADMRVRMARHEHRSDTRRKAALALMRAIGVRKIDRPDISASVRKNAAKLEIPLESAVPSEYCEVITKPDRSKIKAALENGLEANWAALAEPTESLTVRTK